MSDDNAPGSEPQDDGEQGLMQLGKAGKVNRLLLFGLAGMLLLNLIAWVLVFVLGASVVRILERARHVQPIGAAAVVSAAPTDDSRRGRGVSMNRRVWVAVCVLLGSCTPNAAPTDAAVATDGEMIDAGAVDTVAGDAGPPVCRASSVPGCQETCQFFYDCQGCGELLRPSPGDCCVFCSYGSVPCPPIQEAREGDRQATCCAG